MSEGVDYSFARPSAAGLAAAGKRFAGRYVGPGSGKFLSPVERDALFAHGIDIFLLAEGSADSARGGYGVGAEHARLALNHARQLGAPNSAAIYFAVDYDVVKGGWDAPREYLRGAGSVIGPGRVGVYGEHDVMVWAQRDGVAAWFFQAYAWSYGQWFAGNHVEQYLNGVIVAGGEVDLCRSMTPNFGQWRADGADPGQIFPGNPSIEQQGDPDMPRMFHVTNGKLAGLIGITSGPTWYHIPAGPKEDPGLYVRACTGLWGLNDRPGSADNPAGIWDVNEEWLAGFGQQVLPPTSTGGSGGSGPTLDQMRTAVRLELDNTRFAGKQTA